MYELLCGVMAFDKPSKCSIFHLNPEPCSNTLYYSPLCYFAVVLLSECIRVEYILMTLHWKLKMTLHFLWRYSHPSSHHVQRIGQHGCRGPRHRPSQ